MTNKLHFSKARWLLVPILAIMCSTQVLGANQTYTLVAQGDLSSLSSSDKVLIVSSNGSSDYYALKNEQKTSNANLAETSVTISSNTITADLEDNYTWYLEFKSNQTISGNSYPTFYVKSAAGDYYLSNTGNTGSTVNTKNATDNNNVWAIGYQGSYTNKNGTYYVTGLYNMGQSRMIAHYSSDWRCYASSNWPNLSGRVVQIYKMQASGYSITYHCNDATSGCPSNASGQSALPNPLPTPTKTGFTFGGWYTDAALTSVASAGATLSANADLYAKWTCNVTLNRNGATETINNVVYGTDLDDIDGTGAQGGCSAWTFEGWSKTQRAAQNNSTPMTLVTTVDGAGPYYAVYSHTEGGGGGEPSFSSYQLVTSAPDDWSGKYLLSTGTYTATGVLSSSHLVRDTYTTFTTEATSREFTLTKVGDVGYSILFGGNKYLGYTNSSTNFANTTTEPTTTSTSYLWTPSTSGITNVNYTARTIADGGSDFRPYSEPSSGIVYLYKRIESGSTTYYSTTATCCTELGTINGSILWTAVFYCINAYKLNS